MAMQPSQFCHGGQHRLVHQYPAKFQELALHCLSCPCNTSMHTRTISMCCASTITWELKNWIVAHSQRSCAWSLCRGSCIILDHFVGKSIVTRAGHSTCTIGMKCFTTVFALFRTSRSPLDGQNFMLKNSHIYVSHCHWMLVKPSDQVQPHLISQQGELAYMQSAD